MSWREFEELAAQIYRELSPDAVVTHDDKIQGFESETLRQIDVSIRFKIAAHDLLTIIQAKDIGRPADLNVVGEFATVIRDVRANKGILICRSGFSESAQILAQKHGIDLCNIHDAQSRDWALEVQLPVLWTDLTPHLKLDAKVAVEGGDSFPGNLQNWVISSDKGHTNSNILGLFAQAWNSGALPLDTGRTHQFRYRDQKCIELEGHDKSGQQVWRQITELTATYTVSRRSWLGAFTPQECRGILNYKDGSFTVSHLPLGSIPKTRDESWKEVDDPENLAISVPGTLITSEGWQIIPDGAHIESMEIKFS